MKCNILQSCKFENVFSNQLLIRHFAFFHVCPDAMIPDSKVHGATMGSIWGRQDPGGPHVDPMNFDPMSSEAERNI